MKRDSRFALCLALIAASGLAVLALPRGYKEDFNGCATQSPSQAERDRCCKETFDDCQAQCTKDWEANGTDPINCASDCTWAAIGCKKGETIPLKLNWPGISAVEVAGLSTEGGRTIPVPGYDLVASRTAVLVELRAQGLDGGCTAFVVACNCPAGALARGQECRASIDGNATTCRVCPRGGAASACKPCPDCRPELLSAQACATPDQPAPRRHGATQSK
jgi:hypothetical protein